MRFIHVTPESENYFPLYSVEYIRKNDRNRCWTQYHLTHSKFWARWHSLRAWHSLRKDNHIRVRVL